MAAVGGRRYATWRYRGCAPFDGRDLARGDRRCREQSAGHVL